MSETQHGTDNATFDLLQQGAALAVNSVLSANGAKALMHETYDTLTVHAFGRKVEGEVSDAFRIALRQDPLCHAPFGPDRIVIGEVGVDPDAVAYSRLLSRSLSALWPNDQAAIMGQDQAIATLRFAHGASGGGGAFTLPRMGAFFRRIATRGASSYCAALESGHVVNLRRFSVGNHRLEANRHASLIPALLEAARDPENADAPIDPAAFIRATRVKIPAQHIIQLLNTAMRSGVQFQGATD